MFRKKERARKQEERQDGACILKGVVKSIDQLEGGLSRIEVRDGGKSRYGYSSTPAGELRLIYMGKGYVEIPVAHASDGCPVKVAEMR